MRQLRLLISGRHSQKRGGPEQARPFFGYYDSPATLPEFNQFGVMPGMFQSPQVDSSER